MTTLVEIVKENLNLNIQNPETFCKKLIDSFNDKEQEIFIKNFFIYQKYNPLTDYVVELGKIYEWLGFTTLGNAKRVLIKHFKEDEDYKIIFIQVDKNKSPSENGNEIKLETRGRHSEKIMMNVNCFKNLCLIAQTEEAKKIHKYYVKLENIVFEYITNEINLTIKDKTEKTLINSFISKPVFYIGETGLVENKKKIYKFGFTRNIYDRIRDHKRTYGSDFYLVYVKDFAKIELLESEFKKIMIDKKRNYSLIINELNRTELFLIDEEFTIDKAIDIVESICNSMLKIPDYENTELEQKRIDLRLKEIELTIKQLELEKELHLKKLELELENQIMLQKIVIENKKDEIIKESNSSLNPIEVFINKYCEFDIDTKEKRCLIHCSKLYNEYLEKHKLNYNHEPIHRKEFDNYIKKRYDLKQHVCNVNYESRTSWIGIRMKESPTIFIEKLINDFVVEKCELRETAFIDTKILYDKFEEYCKNIEEYKINKKNGFTRQNFRTILFKLYPTITYEEWIINGKKHGFKGIKTKDMTTIDDLIEQFVNEKCEKIYGYRTKKTLLFETFLNFSKDKNTKVGRTQFYDILKKQNQDITEKYISKSDKGFIGIKII